MEDEKTEREDLRDEVEDTDADTRDVDTEVEDARDEVVEDTDADTRDVAEMIGALSDKLDALIEKVTAGFGSAAALAIDNGATISQGDDIAVEATEDYVALEDLDFI